MSISASPIHISHCTHSGEPWSGAVRPSATAIVSGVTAMTAPPSGYSDLSADWAALRGAAVFLGGAFSDGL